MGAGAADTVRLEEPAVTGEYSLPEMMCVQAAREIAGSGQTFVGQGLPLLSATLAKVHHDPSIIFTTEVGIVDWDPPLGEVERVPPNIADAVLDRGAAYVGDMVDVLGAMLMGGHVDTTVLGAGEVDRYGNLNALLIGDPRAPETRFPGTAGNTDLACLAKRLISIMSLEPRRFVERVSFLTSPSYISGPGARRKAGLPDQGPNLVVSTMGVFDFDTPDGGRTGTCEMRLAKIFPGIDVSTIEAIIPWPLKVAENLEQCAPPTDAELALLRQLDAGTFLVPGRY